MRDGSLGPLGGGHGFGNAVEADETFIGRKEGAETPKGGYSHMDAVLALVERGVKGVYQHCDEKHLHRYVAEFEFRYNNRIALGVDDRDRAEAALLGVKGKRLTYRRTGRVAATEEVAPR